MAGVNLKIVQATMRHSSATLTLDTYGHLMPGAESEAVANIDGLLNPVPEQLQATGTLDECQHQCQQLERETVRFPANDCKGNAQTRSQFNTNAIQQVSCEFPGNSDVLRLNAADGEESGDGWESNPPGYFSAATTDLKSAAVTRSAYTPVELK